MELLLIQISLTMLMLVGYSQLAEKPQIIFHKRLKLKCNLLFAADLKLYLTVNGKKLLRKTHSQ